MERPIYIPIGNIRKPVGTKGNLLLYIKEELEDLVYELEHIFIFTEGQYLPFFIEPIEEDRNDTVIKLEEVNSPEIATSLSGKKIYVTPDQVDESLLITVNKFAELQDFEVYNNKVSLGKVKEIMELPSQLMLKIEYNNTEKLIPLVDQFIVDINLKKKKIIMELPEGILDL